MYADPGESVETGIAKTDRHPWKRTDPGFASRHSGNHQGSGKTGPVQAVDDASDLSSLLPITKPDGHAAGLEGFQDDRLDGLRNRRMRFENLTMILFPFI